MQLIFISGSLRRSSRQVALLAVSRDTFTRTFVPFTQIDNSLGGFTPIIDESTGKITGYKTEVGADTVFPFSSELELIGSVSGNGTIDCSNKISDYNSLTSENFIIVFKSMTVRSVFYRIGTGESYDTSSNINVSKNYDQSTGKLSISGLYCYLRSGNSANYADAYVTLKSDVYLKR